MEQLSGGKLSPLVWKAFLRLLPIQIIEIIVFAINTFVDSLITSRCLGTDAMAAIGFFGPVAMVIGITDVIIFGTQIVCGRFIGSGEGDKVVSLFSTGVVFLGAFSLAITVLCLSFRQPLALLLGAEGNVAGLVADYITGYAPGIIGQVLVGMLMVFLPYNNDLKRCYLGIGVMVVSNTVLDILLVGVWKIGIFGMGIATSLSYLLSCAVMIPGFTSKTKAVYFRWKGFCFGRLPEAALFGLPSLMMVAGCTVRGYVMNLSLMSGVGTAAVAAMTVQGNVCAIVGAIPMGCANAFLTMGSIYYGEEDRRSLVSLMRFSLRFGTLLSAFVMVLLMALSGPLASLFFSPAEEAWGILRIRVGARHRLSITFISEKRWNFWNTMPMLRRIRSTFAPLAVISCPSIRICPASGFSSRQRERRKTLFPQPDPPMMAMRSPCSTVRSISLSTCREPKDFFRPLTSIRLMRPPPFSSL